MSASTNSALAFHGKGGAIATVLIEGATGRPCGHAYVPCDSLAIVAGLRGTVVLRENLRNVTRMAVPRTETCTGPQAPLAVSGVSDRNSSPVLFRWDSHRKPSAATDKAC
jgi:hypothetical protein